MNGTMGSESAVTRRDFLHTLAVGAVLAATSCNAPPLGRGLSKMKPIKGSWISIWWDDPRHYYWNDTCLSFTAEQWGLAVKDVADIGMEYLVLMSVARDGKAFFDTPLFPKLKMVCDDPIEALLRGGDKYGVKFFLSSDWDDVAMSTPERVRQRLQMMGELAQRYAGHSSFHGWYWPKEASLSPYFHEPFIKYVNECSREAHKLTPRAKTLTAPFGTRLAVCDDRFMKQLERIDVDYMAYQDEVGCGRIGPRESGAAFAKLREAHNKVPQRGLWADVEMFTWEGRVDYRDTPLIPASFTRIRQQLEAVSSFADTILIYQYQGMMNNPRSKAFAGHPDSVRLYSDYVEWLKRG